LFPQEGHGKAGLTIKYPHCGQVVAGIISPHIPFYGTLFLCKQHCTIPRRRLTKINLPVCEAHLLLRVPPMTVNQADNKVDKYHRRQKHQKFKQPHDRHQKD
jgi:hypothetical protein